MPDLDKQLLLIGKSRATAILARLWEIRKNRSAKGIVSGSK